MVSTCPANQRTDSGTATPTGVVPTFTRSELDQFMKKFPWSPSSPHPTYMVIHNKVYDIKDLIPGHPGGAVILTHVGRDGSDAFDAFHPESTAEVLADYYVGDLVPEDQVRVEDKFAERIRALKLDFDAAGLYKSNKLYFFIQFSILCTLAAVAIALVVLYPTSTPLLLASATLMGLFWQQSGWLSHDFLHHAVFRNRDANNLVGYLVGGVFQGFSVSWWKDKHNTHHAQPNVHGEDPDIDTMPLLAWSEHALELFSEVHPADVAASPWLARVFVPRQAVLYFPILAIARVSWAIQSALYVTPLWKKKVDGAGIPTLEQASVALHWVWYLGMLATCLTPWRAVMYFAASQAACGLLLASVFSLNHNGMRILSQHEADHMDFYTKQIVTGRDVHPSVLVSWFCGGLNFQIEHHLFPNMPRHSYPQVKPVIQRLCKEYEVDHHNTGFWEGTWEVLRRLDEISHLAVSKSAVGDRASKAQ